MHLRIPTRRLAVLGTTAAGLVLTASSLTVAQSPSAPAAMAVPDPVTDGSVTLGVAFPNSDTFLSRVQDAIRRRRPPSRRHGPRSSTPRTTPRPSWTQVENFVSQGVSAIIVVPVDTSAAQPMADAAKAANIPIVFVNRNPSISRRALRRFRLPLRGHRGDGRSSPSSPAARATSSSSRARSPNEAAVLRTQGCNDVVAKNPGMKVVATQAGDWDRAKGQSITENWIQSGLLKAGMVVCANNDEMALGAINALKAGDLLDTVFVGGVDATSEALAAMQAGDLEVTVFQDAEGQGTGGVDAALELVNGNTVPNDLVDIPYCS